MAIRPRSGAPAAAPAEAAAAAPKPRPRVRKADPAQTDIEDAIAATPAPATAPAPKGIRPQTGPLAAPAPRTQAPATEAAAAAAPVEQDLGWTHQGDEAAALAAAELARQEQARDERLDVTVGPCYFEHMMADPRSGRFTVPEPCPKEFDNCPICPPGGERESSYVMLLTVLNLSGYRYGPNHRTRAGEHVPLTKELLVPKANDQAYFHQLQRDHGSLRGVQLTMVRTDERGSAIGVPTFVAKHSEDDMQAYVESCGMWKQKVTREGEVIDPDPGHMLKPFDYKTFLHKPSAADLKVRYRAGGAAPVGSRYGGNEGGQWGQGRYTPAAAGAPTGQLPAFDSQTQSSLEDLDDDVPF
jgi:hypothetical protein